MMKDLEQMLEAFDEIAPYALLFESAMLIAGSVWLTLALRAL